MKKGQTEVAKESLDKIEDFVDRRIKLESMLKCVKRIDLEIETPDGSLLFEGFWYVVPNPHYDIFCPENRALGVASGKTVEEALFDLRENLLRHWPDANIVA